MKTQNALGVTCRACTSEQLKTLASNVATTLAFRFLRPADEGDREDAFDGLLALCWKARSNLCILPTWSEKAQGKTVWTCTHEFIEDKVLDFLSRYDGQAEEQILSAALRNKFRYIGHKLHGAMVDEIRRRTAIKNQEPYCESIGLDDLSVSPLWQVSALLLARCLRMAPRLKERNRTNEAPEGIYLSPRKELVCPLLR